MPTTGELGAGIPKAGGGVSYPASVFGDWTLLHANLAATAEGATELLRPTVTTLDAGVRLLKVSGACKGIMLRARYDAAASSVTNPVVRLYGITGADLVTDGVLSDVGANPVERLDALTAAAAGLTVTMATAAAVNMLRDNVYRYTDVLTVSGSPFFDVRGAKWIMALTETAGTATGGTFTTIELMVKALNA